MKKMFPLMAKVFGYDTKRNLVGEKERIMGEDIDKVMNECDVVLQDTFTTKHKRIVMETIDRIATWINSMTCSFHLHKFHFISKTMIHLLLESAIQESEL